MRIFALSDIHVDYEDNARWIAAISADEYLNDVLLLAGDVSHDENLLADQFAILARRFRQVFFVPGNHDLWIRDNKYESSYEKFLSILDLAAVHGITTMPMSIESVRIVPMLSWYDYSFGQPSQKLLELWMDYRLCRWHSDDDEESVTRYFLAMNDCSNIANDHTVVSFSHFLPRIDVMPERIPEKHRFIYPVLGTSLLDQQVREIGSKLHIYGHTHVNQQIEIDDVTYINNALAYPAESRIARKELMCVYQTTT